MAVRIAKSDLTLNVAANPPQERAGGYFRWHRRFFKAGVAALGASGVLVVLLGVWLSSFRGVQPMEQRSVLPFGGWILQPLVSGNLAICLLWVWLDRFAIRFCGRNSETRDYFFVVMLFVVFASTIFCLGTAGVRGDSQVVAIAVFISLLVLAVAVPLLWLAVGRMVSLRLRTLALAGFVVASGGAQERAAALMNAGDDMSLFVMNSYLIGLAITIWLLSWTASPQAGGTA